LLTYALKEWAVICTALASGRQSLILRKGGISEAAGDFQVEHRRFWLFPTYLHEGAKGLRPDALPLLEKVKSETPTPGVIRITHFADITGIYLLHDIVGALRLADLHVWSSGTVQSRFAYRHPGLSVLALRVYRALTPAVLVDDPTYAGCRSWVRLEQALPTEGATPILDDAVFASFERDLANRLNPTALV
jgi:hypothetical protein